MNQAPTEYRKRWVW